MTLASSATPRLTLTIDVTDLSEAQRVKFTDTVTDLLSDLLGEEEEQELRAGGWTREAVQQALLELERDNGWVQAAAIRRAIDDGGTISRETVYELGEYPEGRMLRGFTKPVKRIVTQMKSRGAVPEGVSELLYPTYANGVQADGFRIPDGLSELMR
jgi:hypothetical protein